MPELRNDGAFLNSVARLGLVEYWMQTENCGLLEQSPLRFKTACENAGGYPERSLQLLMAGQKSNASQGRYRHLRRIQSLPSSEAGT